MEDQAKILERNPNVDRDALAETRKVLAELRRYSIKAETMGIAPPFGDLSVAVVGRRFPAVDDAVRQVPHSELPHSGLGDDEELLALQQNLRR
jgi:hypothetical protein